LPEDVSIILSADPLRALQTLAEYHRARFQDLTVIGITGSNGKTIVKEWLAGLLEGLIPMVKSPRSFNSQLGVALSLLQIRSHHRLAIIEAGISKHGEMQRLARMIRPKIGIFTHLGDAHAEGFTSLHEKLREKSKLFAEAESVIALADTSYTADLAKRVTHRLQTIGTNGNRWQLQSDAPHYTLYDKLTDQTLSFTFPLQDAVSIQNMCLTVAGALAVLPAKEAVKHLPERIARLQPVSMRLEIMDDHPDITILNDAYNADRDSVLQALQTLKKMRKHTRHYLIISDLEHQGAQQQTVQREVLAVAVAELGQEYIFTVGNVFQNIARDYPELRAFATTEELLSAWEGEAFRFKDAQVLLKGARSFRLERLIPYLNGRANATYLKINLNDLKHNFQVLKRQLPPDVRTIAMVKASAYGSGAWQIARELTDCGVDYFAVAFTGEGIELRKQGIEKPVLVLNPDETTLDQLLIYGLEPAIGSMRMLQKWEQTARLHPELPAFFHLEWDTGMARLGFSTRETEQVLHFLQEKKMLPMVQSVFTHLSSADDPAADDFTKYQLELFSDIRFAIQKVRPNVWSHALNTAGILRWKGKIATEAVRMGIGLYGIDPTQTIADLVEVGSLHTVISQIHEYPSGTRVGYGGSAVTVRRTRVATLPIGYADGIPRRLGNGNYFFQVRGRNCPIIGRICMDMLMIDVTDTDAEEGDEVLIFGKDHPVSALAEAAETIAYEILAGISGRVRRIYVKE
jgi:alanine racemase